MRDFELPGRSAVYADNGMAATSHPLSTAAAIEVLRDGGNAVDAAIAAVAVQCVVDPLMTGIGGDCWALYAPASGGVVALNGSGCAPAGASIERLTGLGVSLLEPHSAHSITIPGAIAGWELLLQAHGSRGLDTLLQPAIRYARDGFPVAPRVAWDWARHTHRLQHSEAAASFYLPVPKVGDRVRLPALAATLEAIAKGGARAFYEGPLAAAMARSLSGFGGLHTEEDFGTFNAAFVDPIDTSYRDAVVYECPPNGQGVVALLILNILGSFDMARLHPNGAERFHLLAEATRMAFRDRDAALCDPLHGDDICRHILEKSYGHAVARHIDREQRTVDLPPPLLEPHKDTVYLTVVDRDLNAVSFINSIYDSFGSGLVCGETGVVFHNRGKAFRLDPEHPNAIAPGKRPMHTIIPGMALKGGKAWCSFGVMGGDYQPVGHATFLGNMLDHGMDPQEALDAPRVMAYPGDVEVEAGVGRSARRGLIERGHVVVDADSPHGGGQAIVIDHARGVLIGGSDPRKDGLALGY